MIIPRYWAEASLAIMLDGRKQTYRRFGWSDMSEADARLAAETRVKEAAQLAKMGEKVRRIDHKVAYNGAEGLPIREEVIKTFNDIVLSRNSYGALCLNTPDVAFADVDINDGASLLGCALSLFMIAAAVAFVIYSSPLIEPLPAVAAAISALVVFHLIKKYIVSRLLLTPEERSLNKIRKFSKENPDWRLRVYKTPHGYRVMVMHACFAPDSLEIHHFFEAIGTDRYYAKMCKNQKCFRARVSPKPWRMGIERIKSGSGVWPVKSKWLRSRQQWVRQYEYESRKFSSCTYVESLGAQKLDIKAERVRAIHDEYSQAGRRLPLA